MRAAKTSFLLIALVSGSKNSPTRRGNDHEAGRRVIFHRAVWSEGSFYNPMNVGRNITSIAF